MAEEQDLGAPKIEFPGTKPLGDGKTEVPQAIIDLAQENQQKLQEIQKNTIPPIVSERVQKKIAKTLRAIIAAGMTASPFVFTSCVKGISVIEKKQNEEKGQVTVLSENKEIIPSQEATTTTEVINKAIQIQGLRLENGNILDRKGEKVGIFVENAIEIDGKMENAIGLIPEKIAEMQEAYAKQEKWLRIPIPFDLSKDKGLKMKLIKREVSKDIEKNALEKIFSEWHVLAPIGTTFLSPMNLELKDINEDGFAYNGVTISQSLTDNEKLYLVFFNSDGSQKEFAEIYYKDLKMDQAGIAMGVYGAETELTGRKTNDNPPIFVSSSRLGEPAFLIVKKPRQNDSFVFYNDILFVGNEDSNTDLNKFLHTGENLFLNFSNSNNSLENTKVFILSDNKNIAHE